MSQWLWLVLLTLASYRVWRLLAEDTILDKPRRRLLRLGSWQDRDGVAALPASYREEWAIFLQCPWCLGFWISGLAVTLWAIDQGWPGIYLFVVIWLSISAGVGLLAKLDKEE